MGKPDELRHEGYFFRLLEEGLAIFVGPFSCGGVRFEADSSFVAVVQFMSDELANQLMSMVSVGTQVVSRMEIKGRGGGGGRELGIRWAWWGLLFRHRRIMNMRIGCGFRMGLRRRCGGMRSCTLRDFQRTGLEQKYTVLQEHDLRSACIYQCVIGSRAYGLEHERRIRIGAGLSAAGGVTLVACMGCRSNWRMRRRRSVIGSCRSFWCWRG